MLLGVAARTGSEVAVRPFVHRIQAEVRNLWQSLSPLQRLAYVGVMAAALGLIVWGATTVPRPEFVVLLDSSDHEVAALRQRLEGAGIIVRAAPAAGGSRLEVAVDQLPRAVKLLEVESAEPPNAFDKPPSPWVPSTWLSDRNADLKRKRISRNIEGYSTVARATVELNKPRGGRLHDAADGTASVFLTLGHGVMRLPARQARAVRQMVSRSFNLGADRVSITDDHGNVYTQRVSAPRTPEELHEWLLDGLGEFYGGVLPPHEFDVSVRVVRGVPRRAAAHGAAGGIGTFQPVPSVAHDATTRDGAIGDEALGDDAGSDVGGASPAAGHAASGSSADVVELAGAARIRVTLAESAVLRLSCSVADGVDSDDGSLELRWFEDAHRRQLLTHFAPFVSHVLIVVRPDDGDTEPQGVATVVDTEEGAGTEEVGNDPATGESTAASEPTSALQSFQRAFGSLFVLFDSQPKRWVAGAASGVVLVAFVGLFWRRRAARRRVATGRKGAAAQQEEVADDTSQVGGYGAKAEQAATPESFLGSVERASQWVCERPQAAASVVRVWLSEDSKSSLQAEGDAH